MLIDSKEEMNMIKHKGQEKKMLLLFILTCEEGNFNILQEIYSKLQEYDLATLESYYPLHAAIKAGSYEIVRFLLQKNMHVDLQNQAGQTPLFLACYYQHHHIIKLLLDYNANVNLSDNRGWTPLMISVKNNNPQIVKLLLEQGKADLELCDKFGKKALDRAMSFEIVEILRGYNKENLALQAYSKLDSHGLSSMLSGENITHNNSIQHNQLLMLNMNESNSHIMQENSLTLYSQSKENTKALGSLSTAMKNNPMIIQEKLNLQGILEKELANITKFNQDDINARLKEKIINHLHDVGLDMNNTNYDQLMQDLDEKLKRSEYLLYDDTNKMFKQKYKKFVKEIDKYLNLKISILANKNLPVDVYNNISDFLATINTTTSNPALANNNEYNQNTLRLGNTTTTSINNLPDELLIKFENPIEFALHQSIKGGTTRSLSDENKRNIVVMQDNHNNHHNHDNNNNNNNHKPFPTSDTLPNTTNTNPHYQDYSIPFDMPLKSTVDNTTNTIIAKPSDDKSTPKIKNIPELADLIEKYGHKKVQSTTINPPSALQVGPGRPIGPIGPVGSNVTTDTLSHKALFTHKSTSRLRHNTNGMAKLTRRHALRRSESLNALTQSILERSYSSNHGNGGHNNTISSIYTTTTMTPKPLIKSSQSMSPKTLKKRFQLLDNSFQAGYSGLHSLGPNTLHPLGPVGSLNSFGIQSLGPITTTTTSPSANLSLGPGLHLTQLTGLNTKTQYRLQEKDVIKTLIKETNRMINTIEDNTKHTLEKICEQRYNTIQEIIQREICHAFSKNINCLKEHIEQKIQGYFVEFLKIYQGNQYERQNQHQDCLKQQQKQQDYLGQYQHQQDQPKQHQQDYSKQQHQQEYPKQQHQLDRPTQHQQDHLKQQHQQGNPKQQQHQDEESTHPGQHLELSHHDKENSLPMNTLAPKALGDIQNDEGNTQKRMIPPGSKHSTKQGDPNVEPKPLKPYSKPQKTTISPKNRSLIGQKAFEGKRDDHAGQGAPSKHLMKGFVENMPNTTVKRPGSSLQQKFDPVKPAVSKQHQQSQQQQRRAKDDEKDDFYQKKLEELKKLSEKLHQECVGTPSAYRVSQDFKSKKPQTVARAPGEGSRAPEGRPRALGEGSRASGGGIATSLGGVRASERGLGSSGGTAGPSERGSGALREGTIISAGGVGGARVSGREAEASGSGSGGSGSSERGPSGSVGGPGGSEGGSRGFGALRGDSGALGLGPSGLNPISQKPRRFEEPSDKLTFSQTAEFPFTFVNIANPNALENTWRGKGEPIPTINNSNNTKLTYLKTQPIERLAISEEDNMKLNRMNWQTQPLQEGLFASFGNKSIDKSELLSRYGVDKSSNSVVDAENSLEYEEEEEGEKEDGMNEKEDERLDTDMPLGCSTYDSSITYNNIITRNQSKDEVNFIDQLRRVEQEEEVLERGLGFERDTALGSGLEEEPNSHKLLEERMKHLNRINIALGYYQKINH